MKRPLVCALVALSTAAWAGSAQAQSSLDQTVFFGGGLSGATSQIELPMQVSGTISVEFKGSEAAGCAALGRCGLSGTEVLDPGHRGTLDLQPLRSHGKRKLAGVLSLGLDRPVSATAHTRRAGGSGESGSCADVASAPFFGELLGFPLGNSLSVRIGGSSLSLLGEDLFATRCPGPLTSDLMPLLPSRRLPRAFIKHGGTIDLSTTRPFSAAGFTGTLRSTVVLHFSKRKVNRIDRQFQQLLASIPKARRRIRETDVTYRIERVSGTAGFAFSGLGDPAECLALDACGSTGNITQSPAATAGEFSLSTYEPVGRSRRDARTLLGLTRGGHTARVYAYGAGDWSSHTGTMNSSVTWAGGGACTDSVPANSGTLFGEAAGTHFTLEFGDPDFGASLRTRCGGPLQADLGGSRPLALGSVPLRALRQRTVTVHLTKAPVVVPASAYSGSFQADITVTLRRIKVSEHVLSLRF